MSIYPFGSIRVQVYASMTRPSSSEWFSHAGREWRPVGFSLQQDAHETRQASGPRVGDAEGREIALRMTRSQAKSWFPHEHKGRTPRSTRYLLRYLLRILL